MHPNNLTSLQVYVDVRSKYFEDNNNTSELKDIVREIMIEYAFLPVIELAVILELVRKDYAKHYGLPEEPVSIRHLAGAMSDMVQAGVRGYRESLS